MVPQNVPNSEKYNAKVSQILAMERAGEDSGL